MCTIPEIGWHHYPLPASPPREGVKGSWTLEALGVRPRNGRGELNEGIVRSPSNNGALIFLAVSGLHCPS